MQKGEIYNHMNINEFKLDLQAVLEKVKSIANIKRDIKIIEAKLPKIKLQGTLNKTAVNKELNAKLKSINPKVKIDADVAVANKKLKKLGEQKSNPTITPTVDNSQVVSGLKQAQKETKTLWERFTNGIFGINLIRMGVQEVVQAVRQAIRNIKELDAIKTNIQMVSGTSDSGVNAMMSSYNDMAKDLSSTTKEVGEAANEFLRMGESVASTNELIKSSQVLSKVGMIENAESASYLISSLKGYKVEAKDSMDVVSKLTSVDLEAAVSAGGLAEALSKCANIADNSGVSMNRLIGYTATVGETTQKSMSEVGNSFQSLLSRMNNIKIGRFVDDETGESLSDTEAVLNKLGIQLRDTEDSYRSFDDVLDDIGSRWREFTKVEQNAISVAIAGTRQRENFEALMNNYGDALKYSETAANSAGSALERYGIYQDSIQAKTNELTAAIESLSTNVISEDMFSGIIEATTGVVEFIDKTNILKGTLAGFVTMGISKAFVSMATGIIAASKSTAQLTAAMALFDKGRSIANLQSIGAACKGLSDQQLKLVLSTKGLKTQQRLAILEGMGLEEQERQQTLATLGFAEAENIATASTFSFKGALNSLKVAIASNPVGAIITGITAAVSVATMAFSHFKQAEEELVQSTQESANAYKESASSIEDYASRYEELREALIAAKGNEEETYNIKKQLLDLQTELNDKFGEECGTVDLVTNAYESQTEAIKALNKEKAQLFLNENKEGIDKAEKEMTKDRHYNLSYTGMSSYTDEGAALKEIAEKYEESGISVLEDIDGTFSIHLNADAQSAYDTINSFETDLRNKAKKLNDEHMFDDVLEISSTELNNAKEVIDKYSDIYKQALTAEIVSDDNKSKTYGEALQTVEAYNEAVLNSENPYDDKNVLQAKENLDTIKGSIQGNEEEWGKYSALFDDVFNQADTRVLEFNEAIRNDSGLQELVKDLEGFSDLDLQALNENAGENTSFDKLKKAAGEYQLNVEELMNTLIRLGYIQGKVQDSTSNIENPISLFDQLTNSKEELDQFQSSVKSAADAYATLMSGNYSSSDILNSIQTINEAVSNMDGSLNWEFIDGQSNSLDLLGNMIEDITAKYAESVLSGAGIDVDSKFGQMLANNIIQAQKASTELEVVNEQIDSLQAAYDDLTDIVDTYNSTGYITFDQLQILLEMQPQYLSCLVDENGQLQLNEAAMTALANQRLNDAEAQAIQQAITELGQLALQDEKQAVEENATAFTNAVNDLASYNTELANTIAEATVGASAIRDLNAAINGAETQGATDDQIDTVLDNLNTKLQLINSVRDKVASGGLGSVVKSGGSKSKKEEKDTTKEYDWIEQAIENVEKEIKELDEVADSSYSTFSQKNEALTKEIGKVTEEIELQQKAYEEYMRKADSIGLPDNYKELVQSGAINIEDITDEKLQEQIEEYQKWYDKAQNASDAVKDLNTDIRDLHEEIKKLHIEAYEQQTEKLKDRLDSDSITEKQYLAELKSTYEQFYGGLEEYAEQYHEAVLEYLEEEKKYLNNVANAAASILDIEIDKIRDATDEQEEQIKGQIELLEARKKPLQDELDSLDDKVRKEELALNLQKAQYDLARAENQRSKLVYSEEKGMHYVNDPKEVRDAQKDVDDAKLEIHKQSIQDQIDVLDDEITKYDELIDQINKSADAQVKALEKIKNKWQEVIDQQEQAKNITILTGEFGSDAIVKILTGNDDDLLAQWKNSYLNTLKGIDLESQGYIGDLTKQIEEIYRNTSNTVNTVLVQNSSGKAVTLSDGTIITPDGRKLTPYNPDNDNSPFGDLYRAWTKHYGGIGNNVEEIRKNLSQHLVIEHGQKMMNNVREINNSNVRNITNNNRNVQPVTIQVGDIHLTGVQDVNGLAQAIKTRLPGQMMQEYFKN